MKITAKTPVPASLNHGQEKTARLSVAIVSGINYSTCASDLGKETLILGVIACSVEQGVINKKEEFLMMNCHCLYG